jgi:hypothetical protein
MSLFLLNMEASMRNADALRVNLRIFGGIYAHVLLRKRGGKEPDPDPH